MKTSWIRKALSIMLAGAIVFNMAAAGAYAKESDPDGPGEGKYVRDVFIAYEKTEEKAAEWLEEHGWEPVEGDFNAGKLSYWDDRDAEKIVGVMGIKRTDDKDNAITDMAVMNMKGGYSVPMYEEIVKEKKQEINEFINNFKVVIEEYRANLSKEGEDFGKKRAQTAHGLLNTFIDGDPKGNYAVNDTGKPLGDLLSAQSRQEGNEKGADLEQIMLESSGPAMIAIETLLTLAADTGEESWLERAGGLTGDKLAENLPKYVPEAEDRDVADSEIPQYLNEKYGDTAAMLADQWGDIYDVMIWLEQYNDEHDLWQGDDEPDEEFAERIQEYLESLRKTDDPDKQAEADDYEKAISLYYGMYEIKYTGDWGETLGDFFNPSDEKWLYPEDEYFLPLAAALSPGQRAGMDFLSAETLILIGLGSEKAFDQINAQLKDIAADGTQFDVYTGINRAAFRGGVAITNEALMEQNAGRGEAFNEIWDHTGMVTITCYSAAVLGLVTLKVGSLMRAAGIKPEYTAEEIIAFRERAQAYQRVYDDYMAAQENGGVLLDDTQEALYRYWQDAEQDLQDAQSATVTTKMGYFGRAVTFIGGILLVGAAVVKIVQLYKYYNRDMLPIPRMIVDESDIVTYLTDEDGNPILDENGNQKKKIDFNTYEYYTAVRCNRGDSDKVHGSNSGVSDYEEYGCYDIADLNCDSGQEWLALYTVKSKNKGNPILADTLTLVYGKGAHKPKNCTNGLHLFTYENAVDLGDTAWAYNNKKGGVYFFWGTDEKAFLPVTAGAFTKGQLAISGLIGLFVGALGTTFALRPRRKEEEEPAA